MTYIKVKVAGAHNNACQSKPRNNQKPEATFFNKVITFEHLFAVFHPLMFFIQSTPLRSQVRSKTAPNILQLSKTTNHFKPASIFFSKPLLPTPHTLTNSLYSAYNHQIFSPQIQNFMTNTTFH